MRHQSIVTKIVLSACGIVAVFLVLGSGILIKVEQEQERIVLEEFHQEIRRSIDEREQEERRVLDKNVTFNMNVLSQVIAGDLFDFDTEAVKQALSPYMQYPEILAIQVWDEAGESVAAAWKYPTIQSGKQLPQEFALNNALSFQFDVLIDQDIIGRIDAYYTDELLQRKIQRIQEAASAKTAAFRVESRSRFFRKILWQVSGMFLILLALMLCLIVVLRSLVLTPLRQVSGAAHELAELDLTIQVDASSHDEIGGLCSDINTMAEWWRTVVGEVQQAGNLVASSSTELSATAKQQEAIMTSQLESTRNVLVSAEEISDVAAQLVTAMQQVAEMLQETTGAANTSQVGLLRMEKAMRHLEDASKSISSKLEKVNEKTEKIGSVVTTINKVSEQTNLLSLNASVEAEKAGEYGRGFAVIAREIRRLADQTAVSTLDIGKMVQDMQSAVASGIMEMDKFMAEVRHSAEDIGTISGQLTHVLKKVHGLMPGFENVNVAMGQQSQHAHTINVAMHHLNEEMQQTTASLQETYRVIEQLNEAAQELQNQVSRFKVS